MDRTGPREGDSVSGSDPLPSAPASPGSDPSAPPVLVDTSKAIGEGTLILVVSTVIFFILNLLGRVAAARAISVAQWGIFNLAVSFTTFLSIVILLGLNNAVARTLAYDPDPDEHRAIMRWSILVSGLVAVIASVLTYLFAGELATLFHEPLLKGVFELSAVSVAFGALSPLFASFFRAFHDVLPNAIFNQVVNPAIFVVLVLVLLQLHWGLNAAVVAYVVSGGVGFVGTLWYYLRRIRRHVPAGPRSFRRPHPRLWSLSVSLWGVSSLSYVTAYADTLILGAYWPAIQVGYYSTAMSLARTLLIATSALTFVFLPVAARFARQELFGPLRSAYVVAARWILILSIPLFLLFLLLPHESVVAIFGRKYGPAAIPLQVLSITAFASSVIGPANACLAGIGRNRAQLASTSLSAVVNVALSFALIPTYGVLGAAAAWGIARALYPASNLVVLYRDYRVHPFRGVLAKPLLLTLVLAAPIFLVVPLFTTASWVVYPLFFVGTGIFVLSLFVTRSLVSDDLIFVRALERISRRRWVGLRRFVARHSTSV